VKLFYSFFLCFFFFPTLAFSDDGTSNTEDLYSVTPHSDIAYQQVVARAPHEDDLKPKCPEGMICVPDKVASKWKVILQERMCQDNALDLLEEGVSNSEDLTLSLGSYEVLLTPKGQTFTLNKLDLTVKWCNTELNFKVDPQVTLLMEPEEDPPLWGFRLRYRLGGVVTLPLEADPVFALEPFYVYNFHLLAYAGFQSFGMALGMDVTRNADIFIGGGMRYDTAVFTPVLGLSLSFN
jgi:hypothetical protein